MSDEERRTHLDELWTRWLAGGALDSAEEREVAEALASDGPLRDDLLADQRMEGALAALGRGSHDGQGFARRFRERVSAEGDGRGFVSSFERRLRGAKLTAEAAQPRRARRWQLPALVLAATAAVALVLVPRRPAPPPSEAPPREPTIAYPARPSVEPVPARRTSPALVARIERVAGTTFLLDNARKTPARPGDWVHFGMGLVTVGREGRAVLAFPDGTTFELGANTALAQISDGDAPGNRGKEAFLARGHLVAAVAPQPAGRPMLITTPHAEAAVVGTHFTLAVENRTTRLDVEQGAVELGRLTGGAPVVVRSGEYALVNEGNEPAVISNPRGTALLVVGSLMLTPGDDRIKKRLETLGFDVHLAGAGPPDREELRRVAVVLLSSSIFSLDVNTQYRDIPVPIVVWEPSLFDDLGMTGPAESGDCGVTPSTGEAVIKDPSHPLAAGLSGLVQLVGPSRDGAGRPRKIDMSFGSPGPQAAWVATWPGRPTRAVVFAYERGLAMPGLATAPARRVGLFLYDRSPPQLTEAGWALFDAAVLWAAHPR